LSSTKISSASKWSQTNDAPWENVFRCHAIKFGRDGRKIFAGDAHGRVNVGDPHTGREIANWSGHEGPVLTLETSPDGKLLVSGGADGMIRLWDLVKGNEIGHWVASEESICALAFNPEGDVLVSGTSGGIFNVWEYARMRRELSSLGLE